MNTETNLDRRQFVVSTLAAGGALVVGFGGSPAQGAEAQTIIWDKPDPAGSVEFTPWISIAPDDTVLVRVTAPDIGQGVLTQAAAFVMEELGTSWDNLRPEYASTNRDHKEGLVYSTVAGGQSYFSGRSTGPDRMKTYMQVAASARERLKAAAAEPWGVKVEDVDAQDSKLTHKPTGRTLRFGEVVARASKIKLAVEPTPKERAQWTFLGKKSPAKVQLPDIVNGSLVYGIDVRVPNMVYAALRQSPVQGGKLISYDADAIKNMPGVLAVVAVAPKENKPSDLKPPIPMGMNAAQHAVAVIAEHYWQARTALDALPIQWDDGPGARWKTTAQMNDAVYAAIDKPGEKIEKSVGDVEAGFKAAHKIVEATYHTPFCEQSPLEPLNGTALVTKDRVEVWHPTQHTLNAFYVAGDEADMPLENVHVHQTYIGGRFGRGVLCDDVRMVVAVAKRFPDRPVHVIWSREEAHRQGRYRSMLGGKFKVGLGADGMPTTLLARESGGPGFSVGGLVDSPIPAIIPNVQIESQVVPFHILTGPYRGPGLNSNAFMVESLLDECALAAGMDPIDYRLKLYGKWGDIGWVKCLKEVRDKSGWGQPLPKGQGRGVAIANWAMRGKPNAGTTIATVAKVEVSKEGKLKVLQIDVAFDSGRIFNEDAVRVEMEGGSLFGLNMSMNEGLNIKNGQIVEGNFDVYPLLRMANAPRTINVHLGGLSDFPRYVEIGEPPASAVGPAVANAIFQATGKRIRTTPFRLHDLSWA
jgi:isoquinoline 1-oxidoreductase beta subunit